VTSSAAAGRLFVLDNSVAMRWCFEGGAHPYADAVLQHLMEGAAAIVPMLWFYEVSNVLVRAVNRGELTHSETTQFLEVLGVFNIAADHEADGGAARIFADVHRVALSYRLTSYDAAYLELAQRRGLALATLDDELIRASADAGVALFAA
jgi:predicted nucleic acid-binding protein